MDPPFAVGEAAFERASRTFRLGHDIYHSINEFGFLGFSEKSAGVALLR